MAIHKLTKTYIDSLPLVEAGRRTYHYDTILKGFGLRIGERTKTFFAEGKIGRKTRRITLGRYGVLTSEQARKLAKKELANLSQGHDSNEIKRELRIKTITLDEVYKDYIAARKLKPTTLGDYKKCMSRYFKDWENLPMIDITRDMVESRHRKLSKDSEAQANLSMRFLRALFNFSQEYTNKKGQPIILDNPVRRLSAKKIWNNVERRTNYLEAQQIKPWWDATWKLANNDQTQDRETLRDYLHLLLFTGLRREEALGLTWNNIDFKINTLSVLETKNNQVHILPLSDFLIELLKRRKQDAGKSPYVFPSKNSKTGRLVNPWKAAEAVREECDIYFTLHDLRRTFASIVNRLSDKMSYYTLKRLLNHKISDVTAGYIQHDIETLRSAMQDVSDYILKCAEVKESATVHNLENKKAV